MSKNYCKSCNIELVSDNNIYKCFKCKHEFCFSCYPNGDKHECNNPTKNKYLHEFIKNIFECCCESCEE